MKQVDIMKSIEYNRRKLGYKQYEFAQMMELTPVQYSKIKSNKRGLYGTELYALAQALNITMDQLIYYEVKI
ncbi:helix-turn-helix domain-containing protein [Macrococcus brunensis]|uniref:helix-turn-helix domain-containing protein n=1 Tax=Macrococcus brunensis TaxID=198483 RepID=UPI001EF0BDB9|nr:helix-turn-helix transcriptional regulator [Macrococcus brunensis]ULG74222.1 helix-turn-helix transcriptional regulator [Macrococcus brunensis]